MISVWIIMKLKCHYMTFKLLKLLPLECPKCYGARVPPVLVKYLICSNFLPGPQNLSNIVFFFIYYVMRLHVIFIF